MWLVDGLRFRLDLFTTLLGARPQLRNMTLIHSPIAAPTILFWHLLIGAALAAASPTEVVIGDFEKGFGDWSVSGEAFGNVPANAAIEGQSAVTGRVGLAFANSFHGGDAAKGELESPEFTLSHRYVSLLLGGGNHVGLTGAELIVEGEVVRSTTGSDTEELVWNNWDVGELKGRKAKVRVIDRVSEGWGHVIADQVVLTNERKSSFDQPRLDAYRQSPEYYREPFRPQFHFTPELNWMNDPNGLVYENGEYHLFYQHNPFGNAWGHMSWGHAVSSDLVHWRHLPIALWEEDGVMIFSGSAVVDHHNTSGLGKGTTPPIIAIYTSHQRGKQAQCLASSNDHGRTWTKYAGNPVLNLNMSDFRDPKVFWHKPSAQWVMVVSLAIEKRLQFYGSRDLKDWKLLSEFGPAGAPNKPNWECPDLFELPVEGAQGATKWVLHVGMGGGAYAGGSGGEYFVGEFDGRSFKCDDPANDAQWADFGRDNYAAVSWSDIPASDGRRIWIGWMNNWETHLLPTSPWRSAMTIPRSLTLRRHANGNQVLVQRPIVELESLRADHWQLQDLAVEGDLDVTAKTTARGTQLELSAEFEVGDAAEVGIRVLADKDKATLVGYDAKSHGVFIDRRDSGIVDFHPAFAGRHVAPLKIDGNRLTLRIFVDSSSVELFADDGAVVLTDRVFPPKGADGIQVYSRGGQARLVRLDVWKLNSCWRRNDAAVISNSSH